MPQLAPGRPALVDLQEAAPTSEADDHEGTVNAAGDRVEPDAAVPGNLAGSPVEAGESGRGGDLALPWVPGRLSR